MSVKICYHMDLHFWFDLAIHYASLWFIPVHCSDYNNDIRPLGHLKDIANN